jgi:hypothetical protein
MYDNVICLYKREFHADSRFFLDWGWRWEGVEDLMDETVMDGIVSGRLH